MLEAPAEGTAGRSREAETVHHSTDWPLHGLCQTDRGGSPDTSEGDAHVGVGPEGDDYFLRRGLPEQVISICGAIGGKEKRGKDKKFFSSMDN